MAPHIVGFATRRNEHLEMWNASPISAVGTWAQIGTSLAADGEVVYNSSNAQNDAATWWVDLAAGTYNVAIMGLAFPTAAIATVDMSYDAGVSFATIGTIDFYNASNAQKRAVLTGFIVPATGPAQVRFTASTRNGSNTTGWLLELAVADFLKVG